MSRALLACASAALALFPAVASAQSRADAVGAEFLPRHAIGADVWASTDADDTDVLVTLCRQHLLLPDAATRRDLSDPATIAGVADAVGTELVGLLS
jgi:hypothetical protein